MEAAAESFLRQVQPQWESMHLVARRYVAGDADAAELVQDTLLRAWRSFSPTQERAYSRSWLYVIMRSAAIDRRRKAGRSVNLVFAPEAELTELAPADLTEPLAPLPAMEESRFREFLDDRLAAALDSLEPVFREVVVLSVAGDLNYREIAEVLDCPVGTIMSRMARARRTLREHLAAHAIQEGWVREERL